MQQQHQGIFSHLVEMVHGGRRGELRTFNLEKQLRSRNEMQPQHEAARRRSNSFVRSQCHASCCRKRMIIDNPSAHESAAQNRPSQLNERAPQPVIVHALIVHDLKVANRYTFRSPEKYRG